MANIKVSSSFKSLKLMIFKYKSVFVVYDRNVSQYLELIAPGKPSLGITADEKHKTLDSVTEICRWLMDQGADRKSLVLAVGGGVTTDMVGFAASIYKRGIDYANIPTTLLGMIDAAVGGKTGVNLDSYKNMLGVIRQPEFTYICPQVLASLPQKELRSGAAEMLKTFIIKDAEKYRQAVELFSEPFDVEKAVPLIEDAAKIKLSIIRRDEFEKGPRRVLNLGHTYGHAIEWWQSVNGIENPYTHGEAVAIGIIQAAIKSEAAGKAAFGLAGNLKLDFERCGLPTELPCPAEELEKAISQDKKAEGGKLNFVMIKEIGKVVVEKI